ncbi:MAG TPA: hypothetical protein VKB19_18405 [Pedobacter sp.]|nr:hypothetical protein [Pedobacter sp.]
MKNQNWLKLKLILAKAKTTILVALNPKKYNKKVLTAAIHESGHAFGAYYVKWKVNYIQIIPDAIGVGQAPTNYEYGPMLHINRKLINY